MVTSYKKLVWAIIIGYTMLSIALLNVPFNSSQLAEDVLKSALALNPTVTCE